MLVTQGFNALCGSCDYSSNCQSYQIQASKPHHYLLNTKTLPEKGNLNMNYTSVEHRPVIRTAEERTCTKMFLLLPIRLDFFFLTFLCK